MDILLWPTPPGFEEKAGGWGHCLLRGVPGRAWGYERHSEEFDEGGHMPEGVLVHEDGRCESATVGPETRVWAFDRPALNVRGDADVAVWRAPALGVSPIRR